MKSTLVDEPVEQMEMRDMPSAEVHLLDLAVILSIRRYFILKCTLVAALLAALTVLLLPSKYTATTTLLPPGQNSATSSALLGQLAGSSSLMSAAGAGLGIKNPGDMYVTLLRGRTIEDSLIERFNLRSRYREKKMSDARTALEDHSTVSLGAKDGLITITVTDRDPKMAADIANGYVDEFRKFSANLAITEASQRRLFFQGQLLEAKQNLAEAEDAMKRTEQTTGVLEVNAQARSLIESAAVLRAQVVAAEVTLKTMSSFATSDNPQVVQAQQQLAALKAQLARLSGTDKDTGNDIMLTKGNVPDAGMEYIRKLRDLKYYETISELIGRQLEAAKLDEARQGAVLQVADLALPPDKRSFPKRVITVTIVAGLAFLFACAWSLARQGLERLSNDPMERRRLEALRATLR